MWVRLWRGIARFQGALIGLGVLVFPSLLIFVLIPQVSKRSLPETIQAAAMEPEGEGWRSREPGDGQGGEPRVYVKKDPALALIHKIRDRHFETPEEVATGPFFGDFDFQVRYVDGMDLGSLRTLARGGDWAQLEANYRIPQSWDQPRKADVPIHLYLLKQEGRWKVERVRLRPTRSG